MAATCDICRILLSRIRLYSRQGCAVPTHPIPLHGPNFITNCFVLFNGQCGARPPVIRNSKSYL